MKCFHFLGKKGKSREREWNDIVVVVGDNYFFQEKKYKKPPNQNQTKQKKISHKFAGGWVFMDKNTQNDK